MPTATLESPQSRSLALTALVELLGAAKNAVAAYAEQPADPRTQENLFRLRRTVAAAVAGLDAKRKSGAEIGVVRDLLKVFALSGVSDQVAAEEELVHAAELADQKGWPGLLAAMLLVPAVQWPAAPALGDVPIWLWPDYTAYLFHTPQGFCAVGQAEAYAAHYLRRLEELVRLAEPARGSAAVRAALTVFAQTANSIPLYFSQGSLRRHAELRGRLLRLIGGPRESTPLLPQPRDGRRLRIGFVNRHFASQTETYTTLPSFEQLDPERFEVILFAHQLGGTPLEEYCRQHVQALHQLPKELSEQLETLRNAALDVVVFGTNVTAVVNEVTQLALYRIAPLQVVNNSSCITSGLPEIDLYVSGTLTEAETAPAQFTERLGLLAGPAHAFNYEADRQEPGGTWTRAALGIPDDALVFVSAANYFKIVPEMQHAWARLLAAAPGSRLMVHPFNPNWSSSYPIKRFSAEFERVLAAHGVAADRLVVSSRRFASRADVKELLRVGDIYLDTFPFGGVNSLVDPLELGLPVVTWEGATFRSRMGAALLRSLGLTECIAADAVSYEKICLGLAADPARRAALRAAIAEQMDRTPVFMDTLAASDSFGELMIQAFDELVQDGDEAFRRNRTPLTAEKIESGEGIAATVSYLLELGMTDEAARQVQKLLAYDPGSIEARHLMGKVLLTQGRVPRAVEYLLAAVNRGTASAVVWRDLAGALRRAGNRAGATTALETALRIDQEDPESWFMLAEFAFECGHHELFHEVREIVTRLAPDDERTAKIAEACAKQAALPTTEPAAQS